MGCVKVQKIGSTKRFLRDVSLSQVLNLTLAWAATADLRGAVRIALADNLAPAKVLLREALATCPTKGVRHAATCKLVFQ